MKIKFLGLSATFLLTPLVSFAQESILDKTLESVVVYGVRLEQPVTEVGSSVTIITAEEIEALGVDFAVDVLALAPGVTINQNGSFGGSASVRIRGAASEQTLVIIDGVVANDPTSPGGGFNFARLDTANIERSKYSEALNQLCGVAMPLAALSISLPSGRIRALVAKYLPRRDRFPS